MESEAKPELRGVAFAAGPARQYRVQYLASSATGWTKFAVFPRRNQAEACVNRLLAGGYEARLIGYRHVPVAG